MICSVVAPSISGQGALLHGHEPLLSPAMFNTMFNCFLAVIKEQGGHHTMQAGVLVVQTGGIMMERAVLMDCVDVASWIDHYSRHPVSHASPVPVWYSL